MRKQITYKEPIRQFDAQGKELNPIYETFTVIANTSKEFDAIMDIISLPERNIPSESITVEDLPHEFTDQERIRSDIDYIAAMMGVDLDV